MIAMHSPAPIARAPALTFGTHGDPLAVARRSPRPRKVTVYHAPRITPPRTRRVRI